MAIINHNIEIFIAVAEKCSITEASKSLFISQPAVSKAIKNFEDDLGVQLFHRNKRMGLVLTNAGERVLKRAYELIHLENEIYQEAYRENHFIGGKVTVASLALTTTVWLAPAMKEFREHYPHVEVKIKEGGAQEVVDMVHDHVVDFGLVDYTKCPLEHVTLIHDEFCGIVAADEPIIPVDIRYDQENLIMNVAARDFLIPQLPPNCDHFETSLIVEDIESVINLAAYGNGIGITSPFTLSFARKDLKLFPIRPTIRMDFGIVANAFDDLTPAAKEFVDIITDTAQKMLEDGTTPSLHVLPTA